MCSLISKSTFILIISSICFTIAKSGVEDFGFRQTKNIFTRSSHRHEYVGLRTHSNTRPRHGRHIMRDLGVRTRTRAGAGHDGDSREGSVSTKIYETLPNIDTESTHILATKSLSTNPPYEGGETPVQNEFANIMTLCGDADCRAHTWTELDERYAEWT